MRYEKHYSSTAVMDSLSLNIPKLWVQAYYAIKSDRTQAQAYQEMELNNYDRSRIEQIVCHIDLEVSCRTIRNCFADL